MASLGALGVEAARRRLPELISRAAAGERIVISRHQKPLAALVPLDEDPQTNPSAVALETSLRSLPGSGRHCWTSTRPHQAPPPTAAPVRRHRPVFDPRRLEPGSLIALDGCALVSFCCEAGGTGSFLGPLMEGIANGYWQGLISTVSLMRLLEGPLRCGDEGLTQRYCAALEARNGWQVVAPHAGLAAAAARLRLENHQLDEIRSLELATALQCGAAVLVSDHPDLAQTDHIPVLSALRI
ncbi:MAG: type II toxin-antitoxin system prevent-host-death family antitoxin [Cyanobacteria bacterium K_DeepCast_0m_m1_088]|nr:type II toxin-antitoxin system prevent-host-death family antitoxin [Cyanobacteria bacterium K_DeepCast_0m_m1_088]